MDVENTPFGVDVPLNVVIGNVPLNNAMPPTQYWGGADNVITNQPQPPSAVMRE